MVEDVLVNQAVASVMLTMNGLCMHQQYATKAVLSTCLLHGLLIRDFSKFIAWSVVAGMFKVLGGIHVSEI